MRELERGMELGLKKKETEIGDGGEIFYGYGWVLGIYLFGRAKTIKSVDHPKPKKNNNNNNIRIRP